MRLQLAEAVLGHLSSDVLRSGSLSSTDTVDSYGFSLSTFAGVNISLSGLSADADIRLIQDRNNNGIVDSGEIVGSSTGGGSSSELIAGVDQSGDYILQVYQFGSNSTNYMLNLDRYSTSFA